MLELFKKLLEKYKFIEEIPEFVQRHVLKSRKRVLKASLKAVGDLGFFYSFIIDVYVGARALGFRPSLKLSKIISGVVASIATISMVTGLVAASSKLNLIDIDIESIFKSKQEIHEPTLIPDKKTSNKRKQGKLNPARIEQIEKQIKTRLGIANLVPRGTERNEASEISREIYNNLLRLKGKNRVIYTSSKKRSKSVNRQLLGRLSKVGPSYVLSVRVVDSETGDVLYDKTITYEDKTTIKTSLKQIASEINDTAAVWQ